MGAQPDGLAWPADNRLAAMPNAETTFHAYLHIPFCVTRCGYCDFNTYTSNELPGVERGSFHQTLTAEIAWAERVFDQNQMPRRRIATIFFGGGTPSLLDASQIRHLIDELNLRFGIAEAAEITLEANPDDLDSARLAAFRDAGVTRISLGVQSFDPVVLRTLERSHDADAVAEVVESAFELGLRTSVDLIFGAPGESMASWNQTARTAASLPVEHISAYALIVEPGTRLHRQIRSGELVAEDDDVLAEKYWSANEIFGAAGFDWYEVSNFTRGAPSLHNLAYWQSQDWWGFGPGAHSHLAGQRWWNAKHPARYAELLKQGSPAAGYERLSTEQRNIERVLLGMRLQSGMTKQDLLQLGVSESGIEYEIEGGNLLQSDDRIALSDQSRFLADGVIVRLLDHTSA